MTRRFENNPPQYYAKKRRSMDFKYNFYDYDISTINCVNVSQVETDFRLSDDDDDDSLKEPKKFYTLTNCIDNFDVKIENSNGDTETPPSTDIPIPIIGTACNDMDRDDPTNEDFINLSVEKSYVVETYAELDLPSRVKTPECVPEQPVEVNTLMEIEVEIPLKCKDCDFTTYVDEELKTHKKVHVTPNLFSCKVCGHLFKHSYSVKRHMRIHNKEAAYKCNECSYTCQRSEYLKAHKKTHTEEKPVTNGINAQNKCKTDSKFGFKPQVESHTKEQVKGDDCDYSATKLLLGLSDSEEKNFKCTECNFATSKSIHLKTHMRKHNDPPFKCNLCEYTTTKKGNFVVHLRNHTGEKPYRCASCSFMCKQFIHLKRHIRNHSEEDLFGCSKCDYRTGEGKELEMHIKTHAGFEQSSSDDLQYETPDESSDAHSNSSDVLFLESPVVRKKSSKTKLHKCTHCDYTTNQTGNLKRHQKTHFKEVAEKTKESLNDVEVSKPISVNSLFEKVFECGECPFKATRKHQMDVHMRVHNGKQLYECNMCDYKTINKYNLSRHQKTHAFGESNGQIAEVNIEPEALT
ncbi:hypothetical protein FQR65_LT14540 [Abscondita terminalis]|nr:hypothetical protein FQR65_LT14540 [Abscondita terminalis]